MKRDVLLGDLFGGEVLTRSCPIGDRVDDLSSAEAALVARAIPRRRREFAAGRRCARSLISQLGHPDFALLWDEDRAPRWPPGVVGSISHCHDLCVVAVARSEAARGIGIDVEPDEPLEPSLWKHVCTEGERRWLEGRPVGERGALAKLLFSAKESIYKCLHPTLRLRLGFDDVEVKLDLGSARYRASGRGPSRMRIPGLESIEGSIARRGGWIFTGATWLARGTDESERYAGDGMLARAS
jgi:4'-phosphopantetheinyl transferase EntD